MYTVGLYVQTTKKPVLVSLQVTVGRHGKFTVVIVSENGIPLSCGVSAKNPNDVESVTEGVKQAFKDSLPRLSVAVVYRLVEKDKKRFIRCSENGNLRNLRNDLWKAFRLQFNDATIPGYIYRVAEKDPTIRDLIPEDFWNKPLETSIPVPPFLQE